MHGTRFRRRRRRLLYFPDFFFGLSNLQIKSTMLRRSVRQTTAAAQARGQVVDLTDAVVPQDCAVRVVNSRVAEDFLEPKKDCLTKKLRHNRRRTRSVEGTVPPGEQIQ